MTDVAFEWDENKANSNQKKHDVAFKDAVCVITDLNMILLETRKENGELRYLSLGRGCDDSVLVVAWTERYDDVIRIISARKALKFEKKTYATQGY